MLTMRSLANTAHIFSATQLSKRAVITATKKQLQKTPSSFESYLDTYVLYMVEIYTNKAFKWNSLVGRGR